MEIQPQQPQQPQRLTWKDHAKEVGWVAAKSGAAALAYTVVGYAAQQALDHAVSRRRALEAPLLPTPRSSYVLTSAAPRGGVPALPPRQRQGVFDGCGLDDSPLIDKILRPNGGGGVLAMDLFGVPGVGPLNPGTLEQLDPTLGAPIQHVDQALIVRIGERAGESAVSHALTASGAVAGGYAGQALIPVPGVGAVIGGLVGGWLGSCLGDAWNEVRR